MVYHPLFLLHSLDRQDNLREFSRPKHILRHFKKNRLPSRDFNMIPIMTNEMEIFAVVCVCVRSVLSSSNIISRPTTPPT